MTQDAGQPGTPRAARRPGTIALTALAVALLVGGGTAVAVGLSGPDATPPPALAAEPAASASPPADAPSVAATPVPAPSGIPVPAPSSAPSLPADVPPAPAEVAAPVSVTIPAIDVESDLLHLGLQDDGTLEVPEGPDFDTAAWYDGSPRPGAVGPAVLEGHVSSAARGPSVFYDLTRLAVGDVIEVGREDGTTATFEVYDLQQFPKDSFPTVQVYGPTAGSELRVITCGGTIAESSGRFSDNIIVFARQV